MKSKVRKLAPVLAISLVLILSGTILGYGRKKGKPGTPKVRRELSTMKGKNHHTIPKGSVVEYLPNGVTKVSDPQGKVILNVLDNGVRKIPVPFPGGNKPAKHVFAWPSGSLVNKVSERVTKVFRPEGDLLMTIVNHRTNGKNLEGPVSLIGETDGKGGWIEWTEDMSYGFNYFKAEWSCPSEPNVDTDDMDVNHLFNGISDGCVIFQPVLSWDYTREGFPEDTSVGAACYWDEPSVYGHSDYIDVQPGDEIKGTIEYSDGAPGWVITFTNLTGNETKIKVANEVNSGWHRYLWAYTALEGYYLEETPDLYGDCDFHDMVFKVITGTVDREFTVDWEEQVDPKDAEYLDGLDVNVCGSDHVELETGS